MSLKKSFAIALFILISLSHSGFVNTFTVRAADQTTTESSVTISGRVRTPESRAIRGAIIQLKDANTNEVIRSAVSSNFGYYKLENVEAGRAFVLSVTHKRFIFALPAHLLEFSEDRANMDFVGESAD